MQFQVLHLVFARVVPLTHRGRCKFWPCSEIQFFRPMIPIAVGLEIPLPRRSFGRVCVRHSLDRVCHLTGTLHLLPRVLLLIAATLVLMLVLSHRQFLILALAFLNRECISAVAINRVVDRAEIHQRIARRLGRRQVEKVHHR